MYGKLTITLFALSIAFCATAEAAQSMRRIPGGKVIVKTRNSRTGNKSLAIWRNGERIYYTFNGELKYFPSK